MPRKPNPKAKAQYLKGMSQELPGHSFISKYLNWMQSENPEGAEDLRDALHATFATEEGLKALMLMEKSVLYIGVPDGSPDGALRELNAVRNFVLEIRRYVSNGKPAAKTD
ncbi:hypothetical protein [Tritonibacter mobilis]|uniref:hypothetical protein n=1 Tax=Tritonibacter mobilis TaxID=379347 RepID=UPI000806B36C|nr:hypothetical protein [Tritonibacter mobilis]